ncbi:MAG: 50S ribosomal protein L15 [Patescibacteria group bacterium]
MQLHQLKPRTKRRNIKRVGRGGKRGTYSGRGTKGQKARSGHVIRPAERDLFSRIPKLRGVKNRPRREKPIEINLGLLDSKIKGSIVNRKTLVEAGLIGGLRDDVKILSMGEVNKKLMVEGLKMSKKAKEKIEKAGGEVK